MKIKLLCVALLLCTVVFSSLLPVYAVPATKVASAQPSADAALEARFLNMLNHNRVYDDTFLSIDDMVNESVLGLLELRDSENEDFIADNYVKDFILSMYGVDIVDMSELNADMPKKEGFVYIIPRGFEEYRHENVSVRENEDGTLTVTTKVTISLHDGEEISAKAVSLFVKNSESQFGYNIISSNIYENAAEI